MLDRLVTAMLFALTVTVQAGGRLFLRLTGCGWFQDEKEDAGQARREFFPCSRLDTFFAGLAIWPVFISLFAGWRLGSWPIAVAAPAVIVAALLIHRYCGRNLFIPFFGSILFFLSILIALLARTGVILLLFFLYLAVFLLGPVLLAFFLSAV